MPRRPGATRPPASNALLGRLVAGGHTNHQTKQPLSKRHQMNNTTTTSRKRACGACGEIWHDITPQATPPHTATSCGEAACSEAVTIANAMFVHADDYALQQFTTRIHQISGHRAGQHIAGRLVRLAKLERATRMRAQYPSIDDGRIIEPYDW